jgi:hypothetical protein
LDWSPGDLARKSPADAFGRVCSKRERAAGEDWPDSNDWSGLTFCKRKTGKAGEWLKTRGHSSEEKRLRGPVNLAALDVSMSIGWGHGLLEPLTS